MEGLAQTQAAQQMKPVNIGGKWYYEGVTIPEANAMKMLGMGQPQVVQGGQMQPQAAQQVQGGVRPDLIAQAMAEQQRMQQVGQNPVGAGLAELARRFGLR